MRSLETATGTSVSRDESKSGSSPTTLLSPLPFKTTTGSDVVPP